MIFNYCAATGKMRGGCNNDLAGVRNGEVGERNYKFCLQSPALFMILRNLKQLAVPVKTDCGCKFCISRIVYLTCFNCVPSPMGEEVTSEAGGVRSFVGWNFFFQLKCIISLSTWTQ